MPTIRCRATAARLSVFDHWPRVSMHRGAQAAEPDLLRRTELAHMNRFISFALLILALWLSGCSSPRSLPGTRHTLVEWHVTLSQAKPEGHVGQFSVRLLDIADDGTTQIRLQQTGKVLSAGLGQYFVSEGFGREGLKLLSASKSDGTARLRVMTCISD